MFYFILCMCSCVVCLSLCGCGGRKEIHKKIQELFLKIQNWNKPDLDFAVDFFFGFSKIQSAHGLDSKIRI
jgi:hypothetical protein